jgi:hypothetical protein
MQKLAEALFSEGNPNRSIPTTPGRRVDFHAGRAILYDERDVVLLLRRHDVVLHFDPERVDWVPEWIARSGTFQEPDVKAAIQMPLGYELVEEEGKRYRIRHPWDRSDPNVGQTRQDDDDDDDEPEPEPEPDEPEPAVAWSPPTPKRGPGRPKKAAGEVFEPIVFGDEMKPSGPHAPDAR